jgi:hypothetical protein
MKSTAFSCLAVVLFRPTTLTSLRLDTIPADLPPRIGRFSARGALSVQVP